MKTKNKIEYIEGDLFSIKNTKENIIIAHVCNNMARMGSGFVVPLMSHWPQVKQEYLELFDGTEQLGKTQYVQVEDNIVVANMIAQTLGGVRPLFYNHLVTCMEDVAKQGKRIVAPLFGSKLAGGNWKFIAELIEDIWLYKNIPVTIYYLPGEFVKDEEKK